MTTNLNQSARIEEYLDDEMSPVDRANFIKVVNSNLALAEELKLSQSINAALIREDVIDLRKKLIVQMHVEREVEDDVPVVRLYNRKWWYAAASLLVLCAFAFTMVWQNGRKLSDDAIFSEFYNSANVIDQTRGGQDLVEAVVRFQQKDFSEASLLFKSILEKDKSNIAAQFYYGISNIETKHYDNAINAFNTIINQNDNLYVEHAEWFLGLCYLKNNQHDKAVRQFKTVAVNPDNFHRQEAVALLKNILGK